MGTHIFDGVSVDVYPTMSTNEKPRNVKRVHYLLLHAPNTFCLIKCRNVVIVLWKTMIFKLLSSFCPLIHVSANSQLAHQIWWFRMMSHVVGSLVSWESCYLIILKYKPGQDECGRCFSGALHYHILSRFLNKPCVLLLWVIAILSLKICLQLHHLHKNIWLDETVKYVCFEESGWLKHSDMLIDVCWVLLNSPFRFAHEGLWCIGQCSNPSKSIGAPSKHL